MNRLIEKLRQHWNPKPIEEPTVDPDLSELNGLQRAAESLRYTILSIEWWLSPNGSLREWLKLNSKIGSFLLIPAVLVVPLVTFILWQVWKWTGWLNGIAGNLLLFPLAAFAAVLVTLAVIALLRAVLGK
jgi:hypothetical protein